MENTLGTRIAFLRKGRSMTQEDLAAKMGVSSQAVSKWENDISCPDIQLLPQLAATLGATVDSLLTGKNDDVKLVPQDQRKPFDELTLRVYIDSAQGDKVRVNLPMPLVKIALEIGVDIVPNHAEGMEALRDIDLSKIVELAERGMIGKIMEMESADGDTVEIVVE